MFSNLRRFAVSAAVLFPMVFSPAPVHGAVVTLFYVSESDRPTPTTDPAFTRPTRSFSVEESSTVVASALGAGQDGRTKYEVQLIQSKLVQHGASTTLTYISEPTTRMVTLEQDASKLQASATPDIRIVPFVGILSNKGFNSDCTIDTGKGTGECVEEEAEAKLVIDESVTTGDAFITTTVKATRTYSGALVPFATVTTSGGERVGQGMPLVVAGAVVIIMSMLV